MRKLVSHPLSPTVLLYVFVTIAQFGHALYVASGEFEATPAFTFIYALGFLWIIGWWLLRDCRKHGVKWVFDMGLFLYIAWPLFMPYYLLKTRGAKGALVILGFTAVYVAAWVAGFAVYLLLFPSAGWLK